jgi:hypothetical protein
MTSKIRENLGMKMGFVLIGFCCMGLSAMAGSLITFNDNGGWCWYQDERVIVQNSKLIISSVANSMGSGGGSRGGNLEVTTYDISAGTAVRTVLHPNLQGDDHADEAFLSLPDGRVLAMYARHLSDSLIHYRITTSPYNTTSWSSDTTLTRGASTSYSNLFRLSAENGGNGRIYDFYRGENYNPNFIVSNDNGATWSYGGWLIRKDGQRPYVKYTSNNVDRVYFVCSNAHPREYASITGTSIYTGYVYQGGLYKMDGTKLRDISTTDAAAPESLTQVYAGDSTHRAWPTDVHLDSSGYPCLIFSVQVASSGSYDGSDLRYYYARWDGSQMHTYFLAYAGSALYSAENDYAGLACLDPQNTNIVYISTNANPTTGAALISSADGQRHYEIFRGTTSDGGATWAWEYITKNSTVDNIRPIVPIWDNSQTILLWMKGSYSTYTSYNMQIVGMFNPEAIPSNTPEVTDQPDPAMASVGGTATFKVSAIGLAPLTYTWYKKAAGGSDTQVGTDSSVLTLTNVQSTDAGLYYCVVSNSAGSATSSSASLMIANLLAYWPLDGNYNDVTGNGYNATAVGSPSFTTGHTGQAVSLSSGSYLICANSTGLSLQTGGTISAWVKAGSLSNIWASVVTKGVDAWRLCRNNNTNYISFHFNQSADVEYQANGDMTVVDGTWHFLTATYDRQAIKLYVDGQLDVSTSTPSAVNTTTDSVYIGSRSDNASGRYWNGLIDDVRIYSFAMDAQTVGLLYEGKSCYQLDPYDLNENCQIDVDDLVLFGENWLDTGIDPETSTCIANPELDLTGPEGRPDCKVDLYEFADIASQWLDCYLLPSSDCP